MKRSAFSMIELVFVIVVLGILSKFGMEFVTNAYKTYIYTNINNKLQSNSAAAVEFIATRLQYRIKDSIIARDTSTTPYFKALSSLNSGDQNITVLEWIATDIDGFRGSTAPLWSGIIDVNHADANTSLLISTQTDTSTLSTQIQLISDSNASFNDTAIYFIGSNTNITTDYGWDSNPITNQQAAMHPVSVDSNVSRFIPTVGNFSGVDIYEYYKLSWTANAVVLSGSDDNKTLWFHTNYQPWQGEDYTDANSKEILMENVDTFKFLAIGSLVKIQVCVHSDIVNNDDGGYSLCKEKTIY